MASAKKSKAVALKYNVEEDLAPIVIASGYGEVAERIIGVAEQRGIPVFRDDSWRWAATSRRSCTRWWLRSIASCLKPPTG